MLHNDGVALYSHRSTVQAVCFWASMQHVRLRRTLMFRFPTAVLCSRCPSLISLVSPVSKGYFFLHVTSSYASNPFLTSDITNDNLIHHCCSAVVASDLMSLGD